MGLATNYAENEDIRTQCRHLMALSLLPINEIDKQYQRLRAISSSSLQDLFLYFERQWMRGSVPMQMWNFHDFDQRTNNICEGMYTTILFLNMLEFSMYLFFRVM